MTHRSVVGTSPAEAILAHVRARADGLTICPSEAARQLDPDDWRAYMPVVHKAARSLVEAGKVVLTQGGTIVPPDAITGAYRIRKA